MIYVLWHQNPDTDSILSAIVWTKYLQDTWKEAQTIKLWKINNETKFVLNKFDIKEPETKTELEEWSEIFLIDHNDAKQSIPNRENYKIVGLIDHHNFGNFSTTTPLFVKTMPVGCTSTVMYTIFKNRNYNIPKKSAIMMISAILSDTLLFKSPIATELDKQAVEYLKNIAEIDNIENYAMEMFDAKSDLWNIDAKEIIKMDFKKYDLWNKTLAIWVLETTNPNFALNKKNEIIQAIQEIKKEENIDVLMFSIIDILNENNITLASEEDQKIIEKVFDTHFENNIANLGNRVSRKKQLLPQLKEYLLWIN